MGDANPVTGALILDRFEQVLVQNLGEVGAYLLAQELHEMGLNRETFKPEDMGQLVENIRMEFSKWIGYGMDGLEQDLKRAILTDDT